MLNIVQRNLFKLGEAVTDQLSQIDKRTLTVIAMGLYIAWPRIAPTIRASIKSVLMAILDKLIINSKIGHWLQLARVRIAAILISVVTLLQPPTAVTVGPNGGQSGSNSNEPAAALSDVSADQRVARRADGIVGMMLGGRHHREMTGVWTPSLSSIAEQPYLVMPVVGRVSDTAAVLTMSLPADCALCDDGATVDCAKTAMGRIPGTFTAEDTELSIVDSSSTLASRGMWYHAFTRTGADGTEEDGLFHMMDTPTGIATIISEVVEVKQRRTSINW